MSARTREMKLMTLSPPGSGHFLVGAELSVRRFANGDADELFGPLTNGKQTIRGRESRLIHE